MQNSNIEAEWVIGHYTGEKAKYIIGLADEGAGYKIVNKPDTGAAWVDAAFRRPLDSPRPEHLEPVLDPYQVKKLEEWRTPQHLREKDNVN